jgi:hypothetical protein
VSTGFKVEGVVAGMKVGELVEEVKRVFRVELGVWDVDHVHTILISYLAGWVYGRRRGLTFLDMREDSFEVGHKVSHSRCNTSRTEQENLENPLKHAISSSLQ